MKKLILMVSLLLMFAIFVVSCTNNQAPVPQGQQGSNQQQAVEPAADTAQYIDGQIVDPNETIEIGEMI